MRDLRGMQRSRRSLCQIHVLDQRGIRRCLVANVTRGVLRDGALLVRSATSGGGERHHQHTGGRRRFVTPTPYDVVVMEPQKEVVDGLGVIVRARDELAGSKPKIP
jgi:hypothetical protein